MPKDISKKAPPPLVDNDAPTYITDKVETHILHAKQYMLKSYKVTCFIEKYYICSRQRDN